MLKFSHRVHFQIVIGTLGLAKNEMKEGNDDIKEKRSEKLFTTIQRPRPINFEPLSQIRDLKSKDFGKMVSIQGTLIRVTNVKPVSVWLAFECSACFGVQSVYQPFGKYLVPFKCPSSSSTCSGRKFTPLRNHPLTITVDWQSIKVQEIVQFKTGDVPRAIVCELTEDLCDSAMPGDIVTIVGVVKNINMEAMGSAEKKAGVFSQLYIHAMSITNSKARARRGEAFSSEKSATTGGGIEFTYGD